MNVGTASQMQGYTQQTRMQPPSADDIFDKIMQGVDTDGDGSISAEELGALDEAPRKKLFEADGNGDGAISGDELLSSIAEQLTARAEMGPPSAADMLSKIMQDADSDGDGVISAEELSAVDDKHQQKLAQADTDGDGIITEEELRVQIGDDMASQGNMPPPPPQQEMTLNGFKDLLASLVDSDSQEGSDTATQIQEYLSNGLGLSEGEINDLMTLLENRRFDISA